MDAIILTVTHLFAVGLGLLANRAHHRAQRDRLTMQRNAARVAADEAQRELEFVRMSDPCQIRWGTPQATAGIDRLIAEIRNAEMMDRLHDANVERVIDLRDRKDGAA